jgi:hypothetical protein
MHIDEFSQALKTFECITNCEEFGRRLHDDHV